MAKRNQKPVFGFKIGPMSCYTANVRSSQGVENHELQFDEASGGAAASDPQRRPPSRGIMRLGNNAQKTKPFFGVKAGPISCYCSSAKPSAGSKTTGVPVQESASAGGRPAPDGPDRLPESGAPLSQGPRAQASSSNAPAQEPDEIHGLPFSLNGEKPRHGSDWQQQQEEGASSPQVSSPAGPPIEISSTAAAAAAATDEVHRAYALQQQAAATASSDVDAIPEPGAPRKIPVATGRAGAEAVAAAQDIEALGTGESLSLAEEAPESLAKAAEVAVRERHRKNVRLLARILPWCCSS
mmetsp:Transcript_52517/g.125464  ORF Transcript_52517/g.125464 Transcript_52517/m.125464 type:complete len:297 (+) Transcript_52517:93-983(+)